MAIVAACTDKGAVRKTNQDACTVQVANTSFGEIAMAVICDGVGGLSAGELASATVVYRFAQWFRQELPTLLDGMDTSKSLDFKSIELVWSVLLKNLNETIQAYGRTHSEMLGTTFTGMLICGGKYLIGHVGDCRAYLLSARGVRQVTEDQTLLAKRLASGEITPEEAESFRQKHVILQSVGTEGILKPVFYVGEYALGDLFVLCCDGAYRRAEEEGIHTFFDGVERESEEALQEACRAMLRYDLEHGEKDNLTVVCVSVNEQGEASPIQAEAGVAAIDVAELPEGEEDLLTMVEAQGDSDEDLPTMLESEDEEDLPTVVESQGDSDEDLPTMVETSEEDLPTMVEGDES